MFKVRKWTDPDTAILYVYSAGASTGGGDSPSAFLFTLKFDVAGKCKIIGAQKAPDKETEE